MSVSIASAYDPVEVDLWGAKFQTVDLSRSIRKKAYAIRQEMAEIEATPEGYDLTVEKLGALLDLRLVAIDKGRKKPSTIVKAKWDKDELTFERLLEFLAEVGMEEAGIEETPPS